ncbi:MAG TPA: peptidoglycan recognition family protein [Bryobacteraceae bacterium]|nr:peptidoglycan recognition family protein [Bryobacteraceae bacterium]
MPRLSSVPYLPAQCTGGPFGRGLPIGLVLHRTEGNYAHILQTMTQGPNPKQKSVHFMVGKRDGEVIQMVDTNMVAYHVGPGANQIYLGIEFESIKAQDGIHGQDPLTNQDPLTEWQFAKGREIVDWICRTHGIRKVGPPSAREWTKCGGRWHGVLGHADVAKGGYFHTDHGDQLMDRDYILLNVWLV